GDADERRLDIVFADTEDGIGIVARTAALRDDRFIAGEFTLFEQSRADPPDQRVEPEDRFDKHVDRSKEVVAAADMPELVCDGGVELLRREVLFDPGRQQEDGFPDTEDCRPEQAGSVPGFDREWK